MLEGYWLSPLSSCVFHAYQKLFLRLNPTLKQCSVLTIRPMIWLDALPPKFCHPIKCLKVEDLISQKYPTMCHFYQITSGTTFSRAHWYHAGNRTGRNAAAMAAANQAAEARRVAAASRAAAARQAAAASRAAAASHAAAPPLERLRMFRSAVPQLQGQPAVPALEILQVQPNLINFQYVSCSQLPRFAGLCYLILKSLKESA